MAAVLAAILSAAFTLHAQVNADPPPTTQPSAGMTVPDAKGRPFAQLRVDPRGINSLRLTAEPDVDWVIPRKDHAWHYREWQWWKDHPWGEAMRPRHWANPRLDLARIEQGDTRLDYEADGFAGTQQFFFPRKIGDAGLTLDLVTTIKNVSDREVSDYGQFFACYTPVNHRQSFYIWNKPETLTRFFDLGVGHLDGYLVSPESWFLKESRIPHCPRGDGKLAGTWHRPVLVSLASPGGWRCVVLIEERRCAALTQGMEGNAMDYVLYPGHHERTFRRGETFSVHIRHHLIHSPDLPATAYLRRLWSEFEADHPAMHRRAASGASRSPKNK